MPGGMDSERTSVLTYPATLAPNPLSPEREVSYACWNRVLIASEHTSELAYLAKLLQIQ